MLPQAFEGVGDVWLAWLAGAVLLGALVARGVAACQRRGWRRLAADQRGASYALPFLLAMPIYLWIVCLIVQASLILMVKMGTLYAAHAAARAAIVWRSAEPAAASDLAGHLLAEEKAGVAAALALTPFASSYPPHYRKLFGTRGESTMGRHYLSAYQKLADDNVRRSRGEPLSEIITRPEAIGPDDYFLAKYEFALRATRATVVTAPNGWKEDVTARVRYRMPMVIPGAGRLLASWNATAGLFEREIVSTATLPSETPASQNRRIGIQYVSQ